MEVDIPMLDIELVRGCNLRCRWCSVKQREQWKFMEPSLFARLIAESVEKRIGYRRLSLFVGGEPLLHPQFLELLAIMQHCHLAEKNYDVVQIFSNGITAPEHYEAIVASRVINLFRFSIDGAGTPESYEYMRPPARWKQLRQNVLRMVELRNRYSSSMSVRVTSLVPHASFVPFDVPSYEQAVKQIDDFLLPLGVDGIGCRKIGTLVGEDVDIPADYYDHKRICLLVKDQKIVVNYDGSISTCSNDLNGEQVLGHIQQGGLQSVWESQRFQNFLQRKGRGEQNPLGYCGGCDRNHV